MPVSPVATFQMPACDKTAGSHPKFKVEGVAHETVFDPQARQQARPLLGAHGLNISTNGRAFGSLVSVDYLPITRIWNEPGIMGGRGPRM